MIVELTNFYYQLLEICSSDDAVKTCDGLRISTSIKRPPLSKIGSVLLIAIGSECYLSSRFLEEKSSKDSKKLYCWLESLSNIDRQYNA